MRYWAAGLLLTVLLFGGGWLSSGAAPDVSRSVPGADPGQTGENAGQPAADADTLLRVWDGEQVVEMTMAEYLPGVVRGEMPAAFHQQALDAQAVAERTFIYYHMARYVHFDVRASRRSRKQIQPISSEKIEICLVRFKSISSREHIHYFRKPA